MTHAETSFVCASVADMCVAQIYAQNWDKIVAVKQRYDPSGRLNGSPLARALIEHISSGSVPLQA